MGHSSCKVVWPILTSISDKDVGEALFRFQQSPVDGVVGPSGLHQQWAFLTRNVKNTAWQSFAERRPDDSDIVHVVQPFRHITTWALLADFRGRGVSQVHVQQCYYVDATKLVVCPTLAFEKELVIHSGAEQMIQALETR